VSARPLALVTGASGGIGLELARCAAADGHDLVLVARRRDALEALAGELASRYRVAAQVVADDLDDPAAVERIAAQVERPVDVLVNNAGFGIWRPFAATDAEDLDGMVRVNVLALTSLSRRYLPAMAERGTGGVLNVASVAGFLSGPNAAVYYATKNYVLALSEALAEEVRGTGATVTALCPGPVDTGFQERAGMHQTSMKSMAMMDARTCAEAGWRGFRAGRAVVIPGAGNKALAKVPRFMPRRLMARMVAGVQRPDA
jgi:short-subunit dehydrogenase